MSLSEILLLQALWWVISGIHSFRSLNLRSLVEPGEKWGPALQINRIPQQHVTDLTINDQEADDVQILEGPRSVHSDSYI